MCEKIGVKGFGALLLAAVLGGICSQAAVSVLGGSRAQAADAPAVAGPAEVRATAVVIVDGDGVERARLGETDGQYGLVVRDAEGAARAALSIVIDEAVEESGVALAMHDASGQRRFYMGAGVDGGGFEIVDPRGNRRFNVGEGPDGGGLQLYDSAGIERFQVSEAGEGSGGFKLFDGMGAVRFQVYDGGDWLGMQFLDVDGNERVGARMGPDGAGDLFVTGGATEWLASACPQQRGPE